MLRAFFYSAQVRQNMLRQRSLTLGVCSLYVLYEDSARVSGPDGNDSHHPPCGPGCLLCLGRATARPVIARQAHRGRRRGRACRILRSQGVRRSRRHAGRRARELCPQLIFVGGHFEDYQRLGDAAIKVLDDFTPLVERISIDEAFADVAGCTHLFGSPAEIASAIRRRVRTELGLPISVGVARTKHLAKIASQVAKPDGLVVVDPATELDFLHDLPVELMWGVGPVTKARLAEIGVHTIGQLAKMPGRSLKRLLGRAAVREAHRAGLESRSATKSGRIGERDRPERSRHSARSLLKSGSSDARTASSCGQGCEPAAGQIPARSDGDGPRPLRRPPLGHTLGNAGCADFGNCDPCRNRRGTGAQGARASP